MGRRGMGEIRTQRDLDSGPYARYGRYLQLGNVRLQSAPVHSPVPDWRHSVLDGGDRPGADAAPLQGAEPLHPGAGAEPDAGAAPQAAAVRRVERPAREQVLSLRLLSGQLLDTAAGCDRPRPFR